jgi:hypothetical protein
MVLLTDKRMRYLSVGATSLALFVAGCGSDDDDSGSASTSPSTSASKPAGDTASEVALAGPPSAPTAGECDAVAKKLPAKQAPGVKPPAAGTYTYDTKGTIAKPGGGKIQLPSESKVIVTEPTKSGNIVCFRAQLAYGSEAEGTGTLAVRGKQSFAVDAEFTAAGQRSTVQPEPPYPSPAAGDLSASGSYQGTVEFEGPSGKATGPVQGRYAYDTIGRKEMTVGGEKVKVVGIEARGSFRGENGSGTDQRTEWISVADRVVVAETVEQVRTTGDQTVRTSFKSKLQSLTPTG